jgi:hypothetical protein
MASCLRLRTNEKCSNNELGSVCSCIVVGRVFDALPGLETWTVPCSCNVTKIGQLVRAS